MRDPFLLARNHTIDRRKLSLLFLFFFLFTLSPDRYFSARAAEEGEETRSGRPTFRYRTVTTEEGLTFRVPEDMPIERRDGIVAPIPFDEYMYGKFQQMDARLQQIESKLNRIIRKLSALEKEESQK